MLATRGWSLGRGWHEKWRGIQSIALRAPCNVQMQTERLEFPCLFGGARRVSDPVVELTPFRKANAARALPFCTIREKNLSFRSGENGLRHFDLEKLRI